MTLYSVLGVHTDMYDVCNIGDYVQALAAGQFLPKIDTVINRETLDEYDGPAINMIMNGWYMHNPKHWPPKENINPLWVSFHMNIDVEDSMLSETGIEYFKHHQPIGCRDKRTQLALKCKGIEAYYSGCLTLTLGQKYTHIGNISAGIYFVDPLFNIVPSRMKRMLFLLKHPILSRKVYKKWHLEYDDFTQKKINDVLSFLIVYSKYFASSTLSNAIYITQQSSKIKHELKSDWERLQYADELLKKYSKADLVVTSRIHCGLPCLGMGTPVIFTDLDNRCANDACRLDGLLELFNVIKLKSDGSLLADFDVKRKIRSSKDIPANKTTWKPLAEKLIATCRDFINMIV